MGQVSFGHMPLKHRLHLERCENKAAKRAKHNEEGWVEADSKIAMGSVTQLLPSELISTTLGISVMMLELCRYSCAQNWNQNGPDDYQGKAILLVVKQGESTNYNKLLLQLHFLNLITVSTQLFHTELFHELGQAHCCKTPWRLPGYGPLETRQVASVWQSDHLAKTCG